VEGAWRQDEEVYLKPQLSCCSPGVVEEGHSVSDPLEEAEEVQSCESLRPAD